MDAKMLTVQSSGGWWIKSNVDWLGLQPGSGTGSGAAKVALNDGALGLRAGEVRAQLTYGVNGSTSPTGTIAVTLRILKPQFSRPVYSYIDGPKGCTKTGSYEDPATCQVPNEKPPGNFAPPARGGSYVDPNFGAKVQILTNPQSWHSYSTPSALNSNSQYLLYSQSDQWTIQETFTGKTVRGNAPVGEGSMWDANDPNLIYSIRNTRVERYNVKDNKSSVIADYSRGTPRFASITAGGAGDTSKDNWIAFYAPTEKQICALDLNTPKTYCASYENRGTVALDPSGRGTLISKGVDSQTGKRYVMLIASPTMGVFSVNTAAGRLDFEYLAPELLDATGNGNGICEPNETCYKGEHADTFEDAQGIQYLVGEMEVNAPCSFGINSFRLNRPSLLTPEEVGGGGRRVALLQTCGGVDPWVDWHLSCAKKAAYCAVSTTYGGYNAARDPEDKTPIRRTAHLSEIFVIKNNGAEIRRLVEHRSVPFKTETTNGYWSTPRASISYDASYVVFTSNFGEPNKQRVAIIETGYEPPTAASR